MRPADVRLSEFAAAAIRHLGAAPFFMMVEGGQIDWACHGHDLGAAVREVEEFNEVVRVCLDFARRHPDSLIVVTGDHETGGLERTGGAGGAPALLLNQKLTCEGLYRRLGRLTRSETPWQGVLPVLRELCGTNTFSAAQVAAQERAWTEDGGGADRLAALVRQQFAEQAGYRFTEHGHTGVDLPVYAFGAGAERFAGRYYNIDINARLRELMLEPAR
jgi:alkaline phosphatase